MCVFKQTRDVDFACQSNISLANSTKQSTVVDQPSDTIIYNQFSEVSVVQHISVYKWTWRGGEINDMILTAVKCYTFC